MSINCFNFSSTENFKHHRLKPESEDLASESSVNKDFYRQSQPDGADSRTREGGHHNNNKGRIDLNHNNNNESSSSPSFIDYPTSYFGSEYNVHNYPNDSEFDTRPQSSPYTESSPPAGNRSSSSGDAYQKRKRLSRRRRAQGEVEEHWVETMVVADASMWRVHGNDTQQYVLTLMSIVSTAQSFFYDE